MPSFNSLEEMLTGRLRSSAIQILPTIQPVVKRLTTFIRTPTWISPPFGPDPESCSNPETKIDPKDIMKQRKVNENHLNSLFPAVFADSPLQAAMRTAIEAQMKQRLNMPQLEDKLIPRYGIAARRLTPGPGYLEALGSDNVEIVFGACERVTENGIMADGREFDLDVLICATGFDTSYKPRFPLIGLQERNLQDEWAQEAKGYMGIAASGYPNCMMFIGPNSPISNGSLFPAIGQW